MAMNAERIYHNALVALRQHFLTEYPNDPAGAEEMFEKVRKDPLTWSGYKYSEALSALASIVYEAGEDLHKAKGGSAYSAAKKLASYIPERHPHGRAWIDGEGRQCFCSGAFAVRLNTPLEGLPEISENVEPLNYASVFSCLPSRELPLPSMGDLKICMAAQDKPPKGRAKTYDFGDGLPLVDANLLKNLLILLPDAVAYNDKPLGVIYLKSEAGDAILLPIRRTASAAA